MKGGFSYFDAGNMAFVALLAFMALLEMPCFECLKARASKGLFWAGLFRAGLFYSGQAYSERTIEVALKKSENVGQSQGQVALGCP